MKTISNVLISRHFLYIALFFVTGCEKPFTIPADPVPPGPSFVKYFIAKGTQYSNNDSTTVVWVNTSELRFVVKFDSSAIYTTVQPSNQGAVNKLYGFSDNNTFHHFFSARFGWNWLNDGLHLWAYNYNDSIREFKDLGVIDIGKEVNCSIKVQGKQYLFVLNGRETPMKRTSPTATGQGYKLFPYFGGVETAPHDITIYIKETKI